MTTPRVSAWLTGLKETVADLPAFVRVAADIGIKEVYLQRLVFFGDDAIGMARPDQALYEQLNRDEAAAIEEAQALAAGYGMTFSASGAASEPGLSLKRAGQPVAVVAVPPAVDGHVLHRQRPGAALLHRAVLAARLRELHAGRRDPADPPADLERPGLSGLPRSAADRSPAAGLRRLRDEVEPVTSAAAAAASPPVRPRVALIVPTLNEEEAIGPTLAAVPPGAVDQIVVADGGSTDRTVERARAAGADVVSPGRGFGLGCLAAARLRRGRRHPRLHGRRRRRRSGGDPDAGRADRPGRGRLRHRLAHHRRARAGQPVLASDRRGTGGRARHAAALRHAIYRHVHLSGDPPRRLAPNSA